MRNFLCVCRRQRKSQIQLLRCSIFYGSGPWTLGPVPTLHFKAPPGSCCGLWLVPGMMKPTRICYCGLNPASLSRPYRAPYPTCHEGSGLPSAMTRPRWLPCVPLECLVSQGSCSGVVSDPWVQSAAPACQWNKHTACLPVRYLL